MIASPEGFYSIKDYGPSSSSITKNGCSQQTRWSFGSSIRLKEKSLGRLNIPENAKQIQKLESFLKLEENWDSYGAAPIIEHCIHDAIDLVRRLDEKYQNVYFVAPGPNGEVLVELKNEDRSIEVVFDEFTTEYTKYEGENDVCEGIYIEEQDNDSQLVSWLRNA